MVAAFMTNTVSGVSFNCSKATHAVELMVCADDPLSRLDDELSAVYLSQLENVSNEGRERIKESQKAWIKHIRKIVVLNKEKQAILAHRYKKRIQALENSVLHTDDMEIISVYRFKRHKLSKRAMDVMNLTGQRYYEQVSSYPEIVMPKNSNTIAWNQYVKDEAAKYAKPYSENEDTEIFQSFSPPVMFFGILTTVVDVYKYGAGAAHGGGYRVAKHYNLEAQREATVDDYFSSESDWEVNLSRLVTDEICNNADEDRCRTVKSNPDKVSKQIANMENWIVTKDGLGIYFGIYTIGPYAAGDYTSVIPWVKLKKFVK